MNKVTPSIRLAAAKRAFDSSQEYCPHWDYENNPPGERMDVRDECCQNVRGCAHELRLARAHQERSQ